MALDLVDYEKKAHDAVRFFWANRLTAKQKQFFEEWSGAPAIVAQTAEDVLRGYGRLNAESD